MSESDEPRPQPAPETPPEGGGLPPKTDAGVRRDDRRSPQGGMAGEGGEDAGGDRAADQAGGMLSQGGEAARDNGGMLGEG